MRFALPDYSGRFFCVGRLSNIGQTAEPRKSQAKKAASTDDGKAPTLRSGDIAGSEGRYRWPLFASRFCFAIGPTVCRPDSAACLYPDLPLFIKGNLSRQMRCLPIPVRARSGLLASQWGICASSSGIAMIG
jgi:hypothetical protein